MPKKAQRRKTKPLTARERLQLTLIPQYERLKIARSQRHTQALIERGKRFAADLRVCCRGDKHSIYSEFFWAASYWAQLEDKRALNRIERAMRNIQLLRESVRDDKPEMQAFCLGTVVEYLVEAYDWIDTINGPRAWDENRRQLLRLVAEVAHDAETYGLIDAATPPKGYESPGRSPTGRSEMQSSSRTAEPGIPGPAGGF